MADLTSLIPMVTQAVGGEAQMFQGMAQALGGNIALKKLEKNRPKYEVSPLVQYNQQLAQRTAQQGFGQQATNYYTEQVNKGLGAGINAILQGGGDLNMINSLVGGATDAYKQWAMQDAMQKLQNQNTLYNNNLALAGEQRAAWDYNQNIPFMQKYYRAVQQTNSGEQNIGQSFGTFASAGAGSGSSGNSGGRSEGGGNGTGGMYNYPNQYQLNVKLSKPFRPFHWYGDPIQQSL